jgi:hypothetical protein
MRLPMLCKASGKIDTGEWQSLGQRPCALTYEMIGERPR